MITTSLKTLRRVINEEFEKGALARLQHKVEVAASLLDQCIDDLPVRFASSSVVDDVKMLAKAFKQGKLIDDAVLWVGGRSPEVIWADRSAENMVRAVAACEKFVDEYIFKIQKSIKIVPPPEVPPEDIDDAKLGKFALPHIRSQLPQKIEKIDPNTNYENRLETDISTHVESTDDPLSAEHVSFIRTAMENGWYRDVFREPKSVYVYRGLRLSKDLIEKITGMSPDELDAINDNTEKKTFEVDKVIKSSLRDGVASSWTTDLKTANTFARTNRASQIFSIILIAKVSENPNKFWAMGETTDYDGEHEVVALDSMIKICEVML